MKKKIEPMHGKEGRPGKIGKKVKSKDAMKSNERPSFPASPMKSKTPFKKGGKVGAY